MRNGPTRTVLGCAAALVVALLALPAIAVASGWVKRSPPAVAGASDSGMTGVSCRSANWCMAVGVDALGAGSVLSTGSFTDLWSGSAWTQKPIAMPVNSSPTLSAVSCVSRTSCIAVGYALRETPTTYSYKPLAEMWDGMRWSALPNATLPNSGKLNGISCSSPTFCYAVGVRLDPKAFSHSLSAIWNGHTWRVEPMPELGLHKVSWMNAVSCVGAADCTAVGAYLYSEPDDQTGTLAEHWNGKRWRATKTSRGGFSSLDAVSCASRSQCVAVGASLLTQGLPGWPIAQSWNGKKWVNMPSAAIPGSGGQLDSVSCTSSQHCVAVGFEAVGLAGPASRWRGTKLVAERLVAARWRVESIPQSTGPGNSSAVITPFAPVLSGISCVTGEHCVAVGAGVSSHHVSALAEMS